MLKYRYIKGTEKEMDKIYNNILQNPKEFDYIDYYNGKLLEFIDSFRNRNALILKLRNNKAFIKDLIKIDYKNINFCSHELRDDFEFMKEIFLIDGFVLEFLKEYNNNKELVSIACLQIYKNLSHNDGETPNPFKFASKKLKSDKCYVLQLLSKNGYVYQHISDKLKNDEEVILTAINNNQYFDSSFGTSQFYPHYLSNAGNNILLNKKVALSAINKNCYEYCNLNEGLKYDLDIIKAVYNSTINKKGPLFGNINFMFGRMPKKIRNNKEIFDLFYKVDEKTIECVGEELKEELKLYSKYTLSLKKIKEEGVYDENDINRYAWKKYWLENYDHFAMY